MIGYLHGKATQIFVDYCFLDVNGVGYRVFIPQSTRRDLTKNKEVTLFTYLNVRDDALLLYGFLTQQEYDLFTLLTSVSGIGPKVALGVLSAISPIEFALAISQKNFAVLTKIPGVGKKTAERLVLELKDKLGTPEVLADAGVNNVSSSLHSEAAQALMALGYSQAEIAPVLAKTNEATSVELIIKQALKEFAGRK